MTKLNTKRVAALVKTGTPKWHNDGGGLYLKVSGPGTASWVLRTKVYGKTRDIGIGPVRDIPLAEARTEAQRLRKIARSGVDPLAERNREVPTFEKLARVVHADRARGWKGGMDSGHAKRWIGSLEKHAFPAIGDRPVDTISTQDLMRVLSPIWHEKPETARKVRQRLEAVFSRALAIGIAKGDNPASNVDASLLGDQAHVVKPMQALPWKDVSAFMARLRERPAMAARVLEFQVATAVRPGEARGARWEEIDLEQRLWTVPGQRMKGRAGKTSDHVVPLTHAAVAVLERVKADDDTPGAGLVFPGPRGKVLSDVAVTRLLKERMGAIFTAHGFRSTFKDWAREECPSVDDEVSELCLAHTVGSKVRRAYARSDMLAQRRRLMDRWGDYLLGRTAAEVIKLHG